MSRGFGLKIGSRERSFRYAPGPTFTPLASIFRITLMVILIPRMVGCPNNPKESRPERQISIVGGDQVFGVSYTVNASASLFFSIASTRSWMASTSLSSK